MQNLIDVSVSHLLNSLDPSTVNPTKEQRYLAFVICKNLCDLCETGRAIVNGIASKGHPTDNLPDRASIQLCQQVLSRFYSDKMFIPDKDFGNRPDWNVIASFDKGKGDAAYKIYQAIRRNIVEKSTGRNIQDAIKRKDKSYFLHNFDKIFADIPFKDGLNRFKNFVSSPYVQKDDQNYVWDFFEALLDIFINEKDNLKELENM